MRSSADGAGAIRFDAMVALVLACVLAAVLLDRLADAQRAAERTVVDMEVASLRAELQLSVASRVARGDGAQLAEWAGRNPAQLAWSGTPGAAGVTGQWRWDGGALSYAYRGGECLQLRLAKVTPGHADGWSLGGGLLLVPTRKEKSC